MAMQARFALVNLKSRTINVLELLEDVEITNRARTGPMSTPLLFYNLSREVSRYKNEPYK